VVAGVHDAGMARALSDTFRARAEELGLTPQEVAIRIEVSETRVRQMFKAKNLREDTIRRLAKALGLRLEVVIDWDHADSERRAYQGDDDHGT